MELDVAGAVWHVGPARELRTPYIGEGAGPRTRRTHVYRLASLPDLCNRDKDNIITLYRIAKTKNFEGKIT